MLRLWGKYLKPYWFQVTILVVFQIAQSVLNLYLPNLQADIIDNGVAAGDKDAIYRYGFQMIGISVVQILANLVAVYYSTRLAMRL
ncbi:MAG: ABC transporter ATP-binding protein, partial [Bifidobacterium crudilactis]|nr:ABC transporter ATP-binding protein [Bifidobacterium crudilactis]